MVNPRTKIIYLFLSCRFSHVCFSPDSLSPPIHRGFGVHRLIKCGGRECHCTMHTAQCTLNNAHWTMHTKNSTRTLHTDTADWHCTLNKAHCQLYTVYCQLYTVQCTVEREKTSSRFDWQRQREENIENIFVEKDNK